MSLCVGNLGRAQLGWLSLPHWLVPDGLTGPLSVIWLELLYYLGISPHEVCCLQGGETNFVHNETTF